MSKGQGEMENFWGKICFWSLNLHALLDFHITQLAQVSTIRKQYVRYMKIYPR